MKISFKKNSQFSLSLIVLLFGSFLIQLVTASSFHTTGSMNTARENHTATLLSDGKVLVVGGHSDSSDENTMGLASSSTNSVEIYDPKFGKWTITGGLNASRYYHTATLLTNGQVLVAGGYNNGHIYASSELYNQVTGIWTPTGALISRHQNHTATLLQDGRVLVAGGYGPLAGSFYPVSEAELYNPITGIWTATAALNKERANQTATLLYDGTVLVVGGEDHNLLSVSSVELYNSARGDWTQTGTLNTGRAHHTATLLLNGKVLVVGGAGAGYNCLSSCELYDPSNGTWMVTGSLKTARANHCAVLLSDGKVLVAGGIHALNGSDALSSAELYDPAAAKWTSAGSMKVSRCFNTMTLLPGGKVLIAGGENLSLTFVSDVILSKTELYDSPLDK